MTTNIDLSMDTGGGGSSGTSRGSERALITTTFNNWSTGTKVRTVMPTAQSVAVEYSTTAPVPGSVSAPMNALRMQVNMVPTRVIRRAQFSLGGSTYDMMPNGDLMRDVSRTTGVGTPAGAVSPSTGAVSIVSWGAGQPAATSMVSMLQSPPTDGLTATGASDRVVFRTASAPLRPGSVQVLGNMYDGTAINVSSDLNGHFNAARVKGRVNYDTGLVELFFVNPANTDPNRVVLNISSLEIPGVADVNLDLARIATLRYNAVAYAYLPLDADILGLDPVRLPSDGRVPIFKGGRVVVVHNTVKRPPQTVTNGVTVDCGRTLLSRIRVFGGDGLEITSGFTKNLDAGTISFTNVAGMVQPVVIEHRIEDEALCADVQITGDIRLSRPLTHAYPADTSYVSSAYIAGTLQAAAQDAFSQETWTNEWSDSRIGNPILAKYNDTTFPIEVTNAGAITERWALVFTSNTEFNVVGEEVGLIISGNTATDLAPVNPATGVPYFTLRSGGWGGGWVAGNVLRPNTRGANFPLWIARTVRQSPSAPPGSDQMTISIRGDIDQ